MIQKNRRPGFIAQSRIAGYVIVDSMAAMDIYVLVNLVLIRHRIATMSGVAFVAAIAVVASAVVGRKIKSGSRLAFGHIYQWVLC